MISLSRAFRLAIRTAAWATPHVQRWSRERNLNRTEAFRNLKAGNWSEAEKHFTSALEERKHSAKVKVELLVGLAQAQLSQSNAAKAQQTLEIAIDTASKARNTAAQSKALDALADLQLAQGDYQGAETTAIEVERLERSLSPPNQKKIAIAARKLGMAMRRANRGPEALKALERAAKFTEQAFGATHEETANTFSELGEIYAEAGNHAEAQRCLRRAVDIHRETCGPTSTEATRDIYQLASSLAESGDLKSAVSEYERLVALGEQQIGGNREDRAEVQVRLAALYVESGRMSNARELLIHAISVLARKGGSGYILALEAMACVEEDLGRFDAANQLRAKAELLSQAQASIGNLA